MESVLSATTKMSSNIKTSVPGNVRDASQPNPDTFAQARKVLAEVIAIDSHIDTIQRVFEQVQGDKSRARKMLGISRATLYRKLKRYNIGLSKSASAAT